MTDSKSIFQQALASHKAHDLDEAKKLYQRAIKLNNQEALSHNNLGLIFFNEQSTKKALFHFSKAISLEKKNITFIKNLITALEVTNEHARIEKNAVIGLGINPSEPKLIISLLISLLKQNKLNEAITFLSSLQNVSIPEILIHILLVSYSSVEIKNHPVLKNSLGAIYQYFDKNKESSPDKVLLPLRLSNQNDCLIIDLLQKLLSIGFFDTTIDQIFTLLPNASCPKDEALKMALIGIGMNRKGKNIKALEFLKQAHTLDPKNILITNELSQTYALVGDLSTAKDLVQKFQLKNMVFVRQLLDSQRFEEAWSLYLSADAHNLRNPGLPKFSRANIRNKNILLYRDQGIGDEIMFLSALPDLLSEQPKSLTIECSPRLENFLNRSFGDQIKLISIDATDQSIKKFGYLSEMPYIDEALRTSELPLHYRKSLADFSHNPSGYLRPDPQLVAIWKSRLSELSGKYKIGFAWKGGINFRRGVTRDSLHALKPLFNLSDISWVNLQYGDIEYEKNFIQNEFQTNLHTWNDTDYTQNLEQIAAISSELDLVIQINNTSLHLAGAIGSKVWCPLLHGSFDIRWFNGAEESDCPWYPSVKLFRQGKNETLSDLFLRLSHALASWKEMYA